MEVSHPTAGKKKVGAKVVQGAMPTGVAPTHNQGFKNARAARRRK